MNMMIILMTFFACDFDFFGGGDDSSKKDANKEEVKKREAIRAKLAKDDEYRPYEASGKRDPFRSFLSTTQIEDIDEEMAKDPKRRFGVRQYALTGIIWGVTAPIALIEDPDGIGHVVEVGEYLGNKWGKVREIRDNSVIVVEEVTTTDGEIVPKPILLTLRVDGIAPL